MAIQDVIIYTQDEIQKKIEGLAEPGSTVFFYLAEGPAGGGPLGRGAVVVELNPNYPGKKQKKYIIYGAYVDGEQPRGKGSKIYDSDKPRDIANWIKQRHYKPSSQH